MKHEKIKQMICISESNAADFQDATNEALQKLGDPEIVMDTNIPFTCYIFYSIYKSVPETVLELLELLDGESHDCTECPYFVESTDRRKVHGVCSLKSIRVRKDSPACEHYYLWKVKTIESAKEEYIKIPYSVE